MSNGLFAAKMRTRDRWLALRRARQTASAPVLHHPAREPRAAQDNHRRLGGPHEIRPPGRSDNRAWCLRSRETLNRYPRPSKGFFSEDGGIGLAERPIEAGVVGDNEISRFEDGAKPVIINHLTGDHVVGNSGQTRDLRWDRSARLSVRTRRHGTGFERHLRLRSVSEAIVCPSQKREP